MTRQIINNLRMLLAEWLLGVIIKIVPKNKDGFELINYIIVYLKKKLHENI